MITNILVAEFPEKIISGFFQQVGQPVRIQILLIIAQEEACVCHLEAVLKLRQASISQHLMVLRKAGLVETRRRGRHIFYGLMQPGIPEIIIQIAAISGIPGGAFANLTIRPVSGCPCPQCNPNQDPDDDCILKTSSKPLG